MPAPTPDGRSPRTIREKQDRLIALGPKALHMVADWDRTLTTARSLTGRDQSTYAILYDGGYLGPDYQRRSEALYGRYREAERSANLDAGEKLRLMEAWWAEQFDMMLAFGFSSAVIDRAIADDRTRIRDGALDLIRTLSLHRIPLLILSAGIAPFIRRYLQRHDALGPCVSIVANDFTFDASGRAVSYSRPLIHSLNKHRPGIKPQSHLDASSGRPNLVLLGDTLEDVRASEGLPFECRLTFGFPESSSHPSMAAYHVAYDVLIPDEGPMTPVLDLVRKVVSNA